MSSQLRLSCYPISQCTLLKHSCQGLARSVAEIELIGTGTYSTDDELDDPYLRFSLAHRKEKEGFGCYL